MVPKTTREAVLGTVACSNPEISHRAVQRLIPETDSLKAPRRLTKCVHAATLSKPSSSQVLPGEAEEQKNIKERLRGTMKVSAALDERSFGKRGEGQHKPCSLPSPRSPDADVSEQTHVYPCIAKAEGRR